MVLIEKCLQESAFWLKWVKQQTVLAITILDHFSGLQSHSDCLPFSSVWLVSFLSVSRWILLSSLFWVFFFFFFFLKRYVPSGKKKQFLPTSVTTKMDLIEIRRAVSVHLVRMFWALRNLEVILWLVSDTIINIWFVKSIKITISPVTPKTSDEKSLELMLFFPRK